MENDFLATIQKIMRLSAARARLSPDKRLDSILQLQTLLLIDRQPVVGITDVANALAIKKPTASQLVERLVVAGDVVRTTDPNDRRNLNLQLTKNGHRSLKRLEKSFTDRTNRIFASLDLAERAQLSRLLKKVADDLA